jgi:hypothetical protein
MSGIAGITHFGKAPVESGLFCGTRDAMAHRGSDAVENLRLSLFFDWGCSETSQR